MKYWVLGHFASAERAVLAQKKLLETNAYNKITTVTSNSRKHSLKQAVRLNWSKYLGMYSVIGLGVSILWISIWVMLNGAINIYRLLLNLSLGLVLGMFLTMLMLVWKYMYINGLSTRLVGIYQRRIEKGEWLVGVEVNEAKKTEIEKIVRSFNPVSVVVKKTK